MGQGADQEGVQTAFAEAQKVGPNLTSNLHHSPHSG